MSLRGATVGSSLHMFGTVLRNPSGRYALNAPQMTVEHVAHFADAGRSRSPQIQQRHAGRRHRYTPYHGNDRQPLDADPRTKHFECTGGMVLDDGRFGSSLVIENARFELQRDQELSLRRITTPELSFTPQRPERGLVVLSGASVEKLMDRWAAGRATSGCGWRASPTSTLIPKEGHFNVRERLQWLDGGDPGVLARAVRAAGDDVPQQRRGHQRARGAAGQAAPPPRDPAAAPASSGAVLQDWTVAYGYRPGQAALWMARAVG